MKLILIKIMKFIITIKLKEKRIIIWAKEELRKENNLNIFIIFKKEEIF